jgi:outer membrane protein assembly factor BamB
MKIFNRIRRYLPVLGCLLALQFGCVAQGKPELLGVPVNISENHGRMAVEIDGQPFIAAFAYDRGPAGPRNSLLIINAKTGEAQQYWYPREFASNGAMFHMIRADNGCIYTTIGEEFVEFNLRERRWSLALPIDGLAMSFTQSPDGKIYFGTHPKSSLWEFDLATRKLRRVGQLDATEQYPFSVAADGRGWVYAGIGTARNNLVAINVIDGRRVQLLEEVKRRVGSGLVVQGADGEIYAKEQRENNTELPYFRLHDGKISSVEAKEVPLKTPLNIHFGGVLREYPDGGRLLGIDLETKKASYQDKAGKRYDITFDYQTNGSRISSLVAGNDGAIYGSTNHPMHMWRYDSETGALTDYGGSPVISSGNFPNLIAWQNKIAGPVYLGGSVYVFDPAKPWTGGIGSGANPKRVGRYNVMERPRVALLLNDGHTAVMSGFPGYGHTGGGMVFYDLQANAEKQVLTADELLPGHSTIALRQLPNGLLVGGTSTEAPGGGKRMATASALYLMSSDSRKILWKTEIDADVYSLEVLPDGNVIGITSGAELFLFDAAARKILWRKSVAELGAVLQAGQSFVRDDKGGVYLVLSRSISRVSPDGQLTKLTDLTVSASAGIAIIDNTLYYAASSQLWRYRLP